MGNIWSSSDTQVTRTPLTSHSAENSRKRKRDSASVVTTQLSRAQQPSPTAPTLSIDTTPDGEIHRYIVRCTSIFWCTRKDILKQLSKLKTLPPYSGLHKIAKWDHFFITFPNASCAQLGIQVLSANQYRGEKWDVSKTTAHSAKRMRIASVVANADENVDTTFQPGKCNNASQVTAKWIDVSYEEQLKRKREKWERALSTVTKQLRKEVKKKDTIYWLDALLSNSNRNMNTTPCCCPLRTVIGAEGSLRKGLTYYRNKNEFTVGLSPDGCGIETHQHQSQLTIGYALGLVRDGIVFVGSVDDKCITTGETAIGIAKCLEPVIQSSGLPHYDKRKHYGYWRQITCREGVRTGEVLVSIVVNPYKSDTHTDLDEDDLAKDRNARKAIIKALQNHFGNSRKFGVFWQSSNHISAVSSSIPAVHLYGIESIHEEMCNLKFRIQPTAFFQVNTIMAERLYNLIGDLAQINSNTAVLDVCCGTGTIGLSLASRVHSVVGIEMNEAAVADAEFNAQLNGITNASFIVGKVEQKIQEAIRKIDSGRECVVILDPPRAGLSMNVVSAVRAMEAVKRVVYVACEANNFWKNALGFCRPRSKAFRLQPFTPKVAYGVDMFPHTPHGELVVLLERDESV